MLVSECIFSLRACLTTSVSYYQREPMDQGAKKREHVTHENPTFITATCTNIFQWQQLLVLNTHKIQHLFSIESVNQGKHFDAPESVAQIPHFIKTYKLELSELLQPDITQYKTFNDFFSRKLKPDARPIHEVQDPVSGSTED